MKPHRLLLGAAAVVAVLLVLPATALAQQEYDNNSQSQAGICLGGEGLEDDLLEVACSESQSRTSNEETSASSEATPLGIAELIEINEKTCTAVGVPQSGIVRDDEDETAFLENEEGTVGVFASECEAQAVQNNNSESSAETTLLFVEQEDTGSLVVGNSKAGQPDDPEGAKKTRTTRGNARSYAEFTLLEAEGGGNSVTVLHCESESFAAENRQETETDGDFLDANDEEAEELDPLADALCQLFVSSSASKG